MRLFCIFVLLLLLPTFGLAQDQDQDKFAMFGVAANGASTHNIMGWGALGIPLTDKILSYNEVDFSVVQGVTLSQLFKAEGWQTNVRSGFAYKIFDFNKRLSIWALADAGAALGGPEGMSGQTVVGFSHSEGGFIRYKWMDRIDGVLMLQVADNPATGKEFVPRIGLKVAF